MKPFKPYYVAIFTSKRTGIDEEGYEKMNKIAADLVEDQKGFLGMESFSSANGRHVTIVRFETEMDIANWKMNEKHKEAQLLGREKWYSYYNVKVCKVEREYEFNKA